MSTTVCSSACRRYSCSNFIIYFAVLSCYMYWLIYCGSHLHILVCFYPPLLCCMPSAYFLSKFSSSLVAFACFCRFCSSISGTFCSSFKTFCYRFPVFQLFQYYLLYICIVPTWFCIYFW